MVSWLLPESLEIDGKEWEIRTAFTAILDVLCAFRDPELTTEEAWEVALSIIYKDFRNMPSSLYQQAAEKALEFIDAGVENDTDSKKPALMDWEQDAPIIIPAINKVLGRDCRTTPDMHWWTFIGAYMEIGEGLYSNVLNIRNKQLKGKKLEKHEQEFLAENRKLVTLRKKLTPEEKQKQLEEEAALKRLFGGK